MYLIDTHTHLFVNEFDNDRTQVIEKAIDSGILKMILPGINSSYIEIQNTISRNYPNNCYMAAGLHPSDVKENFMDELTIIEEEIKTGKYIALGEIGIDLYWDKTYEQFQKIAFDRQILLAKKYELPIIIHVRNSFDEIFKIIDKHMDNNLFGIFHSFTGTLNQAEKIIDYKNFKLGINGIITFKNNDIANIVKQIDIEHIVLETDSPYLSPVPNRGKRNESANLTYIAKKIAEIKHLHLEDLAETTNKNAIAIFGNKLLI